MQIIPEIYIYQGQAVALYKASLDELEVYSRTPLEYAKNFKKQGASALFLIDMDRSINDDTRNEDLISQIKEEMDIEVYYTGGVRTVDAVFSAINKGADKVILGVSAEPIYKQVITQFGSERIVAGIKAKGDEVITDKELDFPLRAIDFAENLTKYGFKYVYFKDIWKQGTQIGPNYDEVDRILRMTGLQVYSSGGVGKIKHLKLLKEIGVTGVGIGKAFYENELDLAECIRDFQSS